MQAIAEKGFRAQGSSGIDAFKTDRVGAMFQGAGSQLEMIAIAVNYSQSFGLVLALELEWPEEFKAFFGWIENFAFELNLPLEMA
ncbi:hypothetical protein TrLO_g1783 [Triparma laevis f. longispina]|uniref:Uncharacterized protein n=1 Tax=Triparma laevis f. longispina TaxID=1714387 RepID=A0A9W7FTL1_9STRA|nr:hypothetical protein TrLO_g1783 [Triparma laevis f. longispina]